MQHRPLFSLMSRVRTQANELILTDLEHAGVQGIAPSHGDILVALFQLDGRSMGELTECIHRTKSTVTILVKKLEAHGYVLRTKHKDDARSTLVYLTPKGHALKPVFESVSEHLQEQVTARLSEGEADCLEQLLRKMLGEK